MALQDAKFYISELKTFVRYAELNTLSEKTPKTKIMRKTWANRQ